MSKQFKNKLITFSLILALIGVASSFCSFLFIVPVSASEVDTASSGCQDKGMPMVSENSGTGSAVRICCLDKNTNSSSDISGSSVKISKLSACQNTPAENNISDDSQNSQISLSSSNSPPGEMLLTVSKKE
jgi:hypothetical protein